MGFSIPGVYIPAVYTMSLSYGTEAFILMQHYSPRPLNTLKLAELPFKWYQGSFISILQHSEVNVSHTQNT